MLLMNDMGDILEHYLQLWLLEREDTLVEQAGVDSYVAVVNFIEYVKENHYDDGK